MNKTIKLTVISFLFTFGVTVFAESVQYVPLAPLPGVSEAGSPVSLETYLSGMFTLGLGIAVVLAVVMLVVAGIEYIGGAASESVKTDAKERIWHALLGLLLAFASWIILNEINPNLLNISFDAGNLKVIPASTEVTKPLSPAIWSFCAISSSGVESCVGNLTELACKDAVVLAKSDGRVVTKDCFIPTDGPSAVSSDEAAIRNLLFSKLKLGDKSINKAPCTESQMKQSRPSCTNVAGLPNSAVQEILALQTSCPGCDIIITGGTEPGHISHGVGYSRVDFRKTPSLSAFIAQNGNKTTAAGCATGEKYILNGNTYVDESGGTPHWHVCF